MNVTESWKELARVIKNVLDEATEAIDKESNNTEKKHCAFCGGANYDIVLPRGRTNLLVCLDCYKGAKAIMDTNHKWV